MKKKIIDVHTIHCCVLHGCKYGEDETCTVTTQLAPQEYPCESCGMDGIISVKQINELLKGVGERCKHCGHVL